MSGRLIILPHKSWHVGKRENIEKVKRDERLAAEEAAAARQRGRELEQERVVELLKRTSGEHTDLNDDGPARGHLQDDEVLQDKSRRTTREKNRNCEPLGGTGQGWGTKLQHVNLFGAEERDARKCLGTNSDHEREERERDMAAQRRTGLAPVPLGEGSAELLAPGSKPWYQEHRSSVNAGGLVRAVRLGREVAGLEAEEVLRRDEGRKERADPMGSLFHTGTHDYPRERGTAVASGLSDIAQPVLGRANGTADLSTVQDELSKKAGSKRPRAQSSNSHHSREKKNKGAKKNKNKKKSREVHNDELSKRKMKKNRKRHKKDQHRYQSSSSSSTSADISQRLEKASEERSRHDPMEDLRQRRIDREKQERSRSTQVLAEREMAGLSLPDDRNRSYNSQFNPLLARQTKGRVRNREP